MKRISQTLFFALLAVLMLPLSAQADCSAPAGEEGTQMYNSTYKTMQFCNGTDWIAMGSISPAAGGGGITVNYTTATYDGDLGGLTGANAKCQAEFSGSYFCTHTDFLRSGETTDSESWVDSGSYSIQGSCLGWNNNANSRYGMKVSSSTTTACNVFYSLACCTQQ